MTIRINPAPDPEPREPRELRTLTLQLPEPWSLNQLLRTSYHNRNQRREMLKKEIARQLPPKWRPMKYVIVDAHITLAKLRDDFELPACLKIELDAAQEVKAIVSDDPSHLKRGEVTQTVGSPRGVRLTLRELPHSPTKKR